MYLSRLLPSVGLCCALFLFVSLQSSSAAPQQRSISQNSQIARFLQRVKREDKEEDFIEDVKNYAHSLWKDLWGGDCVKDDQCADVVSFCFYDEALFPDGECRIRWWFILVLALVTFFLVTSLLSCLCCPCCCLYDMCKGFFRCICCCCGSSRSSRSHPHHRVPTGESR